MLKSYFNQAESIAQLAFGIYISKFMKSYVKHQKYLENINKKVVKSIVRHFKFQNSGHTSSSNSTPQLKRKWRQTDMLQWVLK